MKTFVVGIQLLEVLLDLQNSFGDKAYSPDLKVFISDIIFKCHAEIFYNLDEHIFFSSNFRWVIKCKPFCSCTRSSLPLFRILKIKIIIYVANYISATCENINNCMLILHRQKEKEKIWNSQFLNLLKKALRPNLLFWILLQL